jgi:hypothetical protein
METNDIEQLAKEYAGQNPKKPEIYSHKVYNIFMAGVLAEKKRANSTKLSLFERDPKGGYSSYSEAGVALCDEAAAILEPLFKKYLRQGYHPMEIEYIIGQSTGFQKFCWEMDISRDE